METLQRYLGSLLGLACCDALGAWCEFKSPGSFPPFKRGDGFRAHGTYNLDAGYWTDDTSMALCLAESLIEQRGFDPKDQLERYCRWWKEGHLSSTGHCFDIGVGTARALGDFRANGDLRATGNGGGNGSLMRLAPVPLAYANDVEKCLQLSGESSETTHGAIEATHACHYFGGLIVGALQGKSKDELLSACYSPLGGWNPDALHPKIHAIANGSFKEKQPPAINGGGYCVNTLEAVLWAFHTTDSFEDGAIAVVNLGDDSDSTGAVYGSLAGAFYGVDAIPESWRKNVVMADLITDFSQKLFAFAQEPQKPATQESKYVAPRGEFLFEM